MYSCKIFYVTGIQYSGLQFLKFLVHLSYKLLAIFQVVQYILVAIFHDFFSIIVGLSDTCYCFFFIIARLVGLRWYLIRGFSCIAPMATDMGQLLMCLRAICTSSLETHLSRSG